MALALALTGAASAVKPIGSALGAVGSVFGISGSKDDGRLSTNAKAFAQIQQGGGNAPFQHTGVIGMTPLQFLLSKSPTKYGGGGGWATSKAQEDAWAKYQQGKAIMASGTVRTSSIGGTYAGNALGLDGQDGTQSKTTQYVIVGALVLAMLFVVRGK